MRDNKDIQEHKDVALASLVKVLGLVEYRCGVVLQGLRVFIKSWCGFVSSLYVIS